MSSNVLEPGKCSNWLLKWDALPESGSALSRLDQQFNVQPSFIYLLTPVLILVTGKQLLELHPLSLDEDKFKCFCEQWPVAGRILDGLMVSSLKSSWRVTATVYMWFISVDTGRCRWHVASNFVLFLLSQDGNEGVSIFQDHVEVGLHARKIFEELSDEKELLVKAVASLNMVRRKGKTNVSLLELEEDEEDLQ
ncbi:hypothetical protein B0H11DRAFT_2321371 [Mycena galericulata]|nr:hypothetical protein B0H11DRAFT_2321371 [Mycena galericulata]